MCMDLRMLPQQKHRHSRRSLLCFKDLNLMIMAKIKGVMLMTKIRNTATVLAAIATMAGAGQAQAQRYNLDMEQHQYMGTPTYNCVKSPFRGVIAFLYGGSVGIVVPEGSYRFDGSRYYAGVPKWYEAAAVNWQPGNEFEPSVRAFTQSVGQNTSIPYKVQGNGFGGVNMNTAQPAQPEELESQEVSVAIASCRLSQRPDNDWGNKPHGYRR